MSRISTFMAILVFVATISVAMPAYATTDKKGQNHFDFKVSVENKKQYKGVVIGSLNLIRIEITNLTDEEYHIGKSFRVLMTLKESEWSQFAMAASGPTNLSLSSDRISALKYGYGSNSIAKKGEEKQSIMIHIGNMNDVIQDTNPKHQKIEFDKWWPTLLPPKSSVTITWPTFWFSDTKDKPEFIAAPALSSKGVTYYCWVNFKNDETREIVANTKNLIKIISDTSEPLGLRAASVAWLLEDDLKNEKHLLPYLQDKQTPDALAYRTMQALMIWGSPKIIDDIFTLWKKRKLVPALDNKNSKYYFTWSKHKNAEKYKKQIEAGNR